MLNTMFSENVCLEKNHFLSNYRSNMILAGINVLNVKFSNNCLHVGEQGSKMSKD